MNRVWITTYPFLDTREETWRDALCFAVSTRSDSGAPTYATVFPDARLLFYGGTQFDALRLARFEFEGVRCRGRGRTSPANVGEATLSERWVGDREIEETLCGRQV